MPENECFNIEEYCENFDVISEQCLLDLILTSGWFSSEKSILTQSVTPGWRSSGLKLRTRQATHFVFSHLPMASAFVRVL
jgi:hypothetical protein